MKELKEHLLKELGLTEEQYQAEVEILRQTSPINDLNNIALVEGMQMGMIDNLGAMVGMLMMQINALEQRVAELEGNVNS